MNQMVLIANVVVLSRQAGAGLPPQPVSWEMLTRRVIWPLLSQYVVLPARSGSSDAGCTSPSVALAREVIVCSPEDGALQSNVQKVQVNALPSPLFGRRVAGCHGSSSMRTSTLSMGAPQAAPRIWYASPCLVTLAGADLSRSCVTEVKVQTVSPSRSSSRMVT